MATTITHLARARAKPAYPAPVSVGTLAEVPARIHVWRGASGRRYVHAVYSLVECPPLPRAAYVLVRRNGSGSRTALHIARAESDAPTLNLAQIRQRGATLGADEVHVHFLAETEEDRWLSVCDLRAGQFGELSAEPATAA
jgi:hypothetical protein